MGIRFEFLKAGNGDCILIYTESGTNILIDGGLKITYSRELKKRIKSNILDKNCFLDLVILTHYDNDHIGGILELLKNEIKKIKNNEQLLIKELWFNSFDKALVNLIATSFKTSAKQQIQFDEYIKELLPHIKYISTISTDNFEKSTTIGVNNELNLTLLSPNNEKLDMLYTKYIKETINYQTSSLSNDYDISIEELSKRDFVNDTSISNGSSIAFILEYKNMKFLFLGDAHIDLIVENLINMGYSINNRLEVQFVKLSHHGSSKNINNDFLDIVKTDKFIISTNGGRHKHPNKETLSKILMHPKREDNIEFICNYKHTKDILSVEEKRKYRVIFRDSLGVFNEYK